MSVRRFERLVADALDSLPDEIADLLDNVVVVVEDEPDEPGLLGLYDGVPQTERWDYGAGPVLPDRIVLYRLALCEVCADEDELAEEIAVTVVHELAHHVGIDDDALEEMGWA